MIDQTKSKTYLKNSVKTSNSAEIMIMALEKLLRALVLAKKARESDDFIELYNNILEADKILEALKLAISYENTTNISTDLSYIYEQMRFSIKYLALNKNPPEDYIYFIDFTKKYIKIWEDAKKIDMDNPEKTIDATQKNNEEIKSIKINI